MPLAPYEPYNVPEDRHGLLGTVSAFSVPCWGTEAQHECVTPAPLILVRVGVSARTG